jgi:hypothetical protein
MNEKKTKIVVKKQHKTFNMLKKKRNIKKNWHVKYIVGTICHVCDEG